jgi:iron only hydrogenase large subunit-like protein
MSDDAYKSPPASHYHAHRIDHEVCDGCMSCMRECPTEAIRIRDGKAIILDALCVDCGICFAACDRHAIEYTGGPVEFDDDFEYRIAVPSSVLYAQFAAEIHIHAIQLALKALGFDEVADLGVPTDQLSRFLVAYIDKHRDRLPLISSHCPTVIRLIQVKFPDLVDRIVPINVPRELTARRSRLRAANRLGLDPAKIGVFYISPCLAKVISIKEPVGEEKSSFDGVFIIRDVYPQLVPLVMEIVKRFDNQQIVEGFVFNPGWARFGSVTRALDMHNWLAVSGIDQVTKILEDIENGKLRHIEFVEALTHMHGCMGGTLSVENPYVSRANLIKQKKKYQTTMPEVELEPEVRDAFLMKTPLEPRQTRHLGEDVSSSIKRIKERERIYNKLEKIDCGLCGSPTCRAFAEDVVVGQAKLGDCPFLAGKLERRIT